MLGIAAVHLPRGRPALPGRVQLAGVEHSAATGFLLVKDQVVESGLVVN